jgi:hypothetical protein
MPRSDSARRLEETSTSKRRRFPRVNLLLDRSPVSNGIRAELDELGLPYEFDYAEASTTDGYRLPVLFFESGHMLQGAGAIRRFLDRLRA